MLIIKIKLENNQKNRIFDQVRNINHTGYTMISLTTRYYRSEVKEHKQRREITWNR